MARYRFVADIPQRRIKRGAVLDMDASSLKFVLRESGSAALSEVAIPADLGLHYSERDWPAVVEVDAQLGPPVALAIAPDAAERLQTLEEQLSDAQARRGAAEAGYQAARLNLEAVALRTRITGMSHEDKTDVGLYRHHSRQWVDKLAAASADVARLVVEINALRAELEPVASGPDAVVSIGDDGRGRTVDALELRQALLRCALVLAQFPELLERLFEANNPRDGQIQFLWPPVAVKALVDLRAGLRQWAGATGRGALELRHLRSETDVTGLLERAASLVKQAREQHKETAVEVAA